MNKLMLNNEWASMFASLPDDQAGKLIKSAFAYHMGEDARIDDPILGAVFDMVKIVIDQNREAYEKTCARNTENGKKGGRPKKRLEPTETQKTQSVFLETERLPKNPNEANRIEKNRKEKNKIKHLYGEYKKVSLTDEEHEKLVSDYGEQKTEKAITFLDAYIAEKGYKSKSHYLALRRWVFEAIEEKKPKAKQPSPGRFQNFENRTDQAHRDMVAQIIAMQ